MKTICLFTVFLICFFAISFKVNAGIFNNTPNIEQDLKNLDVKNCQHMRKYLKSQGKISDFSGEVYSITLENETHCVFKVCSEDEFKSEIVAYELSKEFNIGNIPPVVFRTIVCNFDDGSCFPTTKSGYLSLFVESNIDLVKFKDKDLFAKLDTVNQDEISNFKIFNFLFGNFDLGSHNMLLFEKNNQYFPILIDNEGIGNRKAVEFGEVPFVEFDHFDHREMNVKSSDFPFKEAKIWNQTCDLYGCRPSSLTHKFIIYDNSYWVQYCEESHASRIRKLMYPTFIVESTRKTLQQMNREKLIDIFSKGSNNEAQFKMNQQLVENILERRDMLLKNIQKK